MPLLDTRSSPTARPRLKLLLLSTRAPLKSRSGPTEQFAFPISWRCHESRVLSPRWDLGIAVFPHKPVTFPVPAPSRSGGKSCFCPFPTFIQEEPQQR